LPELDWHDECESATSSVSCDGSYLRERFRCLRCTGNGECVGKDGQECRSDDQCASHYCRRGFVRDVPPWSGLRLREPVSITSQHPASCTSRRGLANDPCRTDADCAAPQRCRAFYGLGGDGDAPGAPVVAVSMCMDPVDIGRRGSACASDGDCASGLVCKAFYSLEIDGRPPLAGVLACADADAD
jgi:hypothetical protein